MKAKEMDAKLIQVTRKNYRKANKEIVERLLELLDVTVSKEVKEKGLQAEQPCRLERVPEEKLACLLEGTAKIPDVYLDVCHNPQAVDCVIKELSKLHPTS